MTERQAASGHSAKQALREGRRAGSERLYLVCPYQRGALASSSDTTTTTIIVITMAFSQ
jgi:hypothetical protein